MIHSENNTPFCPIKDLNKRNEFLSEGFILMENIVLPIIDELNALCKPFITHKNQAFQYSLMEHSFEENLAFHHQLTVILTPLLNQLFKSFTAYSASLLIKPYGTGTEMDLHQDWTFTDEKKYSPCTLWIPLQDVDNTNGGLFFLPKSHLFFTNFRSQDLPTARINRLSLNSHCQAINVKKGDLIIFHPAAFHGSFSNSSTDDRAAISITILPNNAPFIHVKKSSEVQATIYNLNATTFLSDLLQLNHCYRFESDDFETIDYLHHVPNLVEIKEKIRNYVQC